MIVVDGLGSSPRIVPGTLEALQDLTLGKIVILHPHGSTTSFADELVSGSDGLCLRPRYDVDLRIFAISSMIAAVMDCSLDCSRRDRFSIFYTHDRARVRVLDVALEMPLARSLTRF